MGLPCRRAVIRTAAIAAVLAPGALCLLFTDTDVNADGDSAAPMSLSAEQHGAAGQQKRQYVSSLAEPESPMRRGKGRRLASYAGSYAYEYGSEANAMREGSTTLPISDMDDYDLMKELKRRGKGRNLDKDDKDDDERPTTAPTTTVPTPSPTQWPTRAPTQFPTHEPYKHEDHEDYESSTTHTETHTTSTEQPTTQAHTTETTTESTTTPTTSTTTTTGSPPLNLHDVAEIVREVVHSALPHDEHDCHTETNEDCGVGREGAQGGGTGGVTGGRCSDKLGPAECEGGLAGLWAPKCFCKKGYCFRYLDTPNGKSSEGRCVPDDTKVNIIVETQTTVSTTTSTTTTTTTTTGSTVSLPFGEIFDNLRNHEATMDKVIAKMKKIDYREKEAEKRHKRRMNKMFEDTQSSLQKLSDNNEMDREDTEKENQDEREKKDLKDEKDRTNEKQQYWMEKQLAAIGR